MLPSKPKPKFITEHLKSNCSPFSELFENIAGSTKIKVL